MLKLARDTFWGGCTASLLLGSVAAVAAATDQATKQTDRITIGIKADIRGTNPGVNRDGITDDVLLHVVEGLVAYREDMTVGPMLAESYSVSADERTYQFELRRGVTFHNGAPLTSHEVAWSWKRMLDPATNWLCRGWYDGTDDARIESMDASNDYTVKFTLDQPSAIFLARLASFQCLAAILHPDSVDANGQWIKPIGTGPYRLEEWRPGTHIKLIRYDEYKSRAEPRDGLTGGKLPHAKRLTWLIVPDAASMKAALLAGQLDLMPQLRPHDVDEVERSGEFKVYRSPSLERSSLLIQIQDPILGDVRVRHAIGHAIRADAIAKVTTRGMAKVNPSTVPVSDPYHSSVHDKGYEYDLAKSRELLEQAKYAGEVIKLSANTRYQSMYDAAVVIQTMLRQVGFNIELEVVDWATLISQYLAGDFQLVAFGYSGRTDPALGYMTILGDKKLEPAMLWENPTAIDLLRRASLVSTPTERQQLFNRLHEMMIQDAPVIELFNPLAIDASSAKLQGYEAWPAVKPRLWGVWKAQ